ncbi:MAG: hypothetical protein ABIJ96_03260 [Elusimicrobiota bacterium]
MLRGLILALGVGVFAAAGAEEEDAFPTFSPPQDYRVIAQNQHYRIISDPDTDISSVLLHCLAPQDPMLLEFVHTLDPEVRVNILVNSASAAKGVVAALNKQKTAGIARRVRFILVDDALQLTRWARDPYIVLYSTQTREHALLDSNVPKMMWNHYYMNRLAIDYVLQSGIGRRPLHRANFPRLPTWWLEGGSVTADDTHVYVGSSSIEDMRSAGGKIAHSVEEVREAVTRVLGKQLVILRDYNEDHSDRYHMPIGRTRHGARTSLLGDPLLALTLISRMSREEKENAIETILGRRSAWLDTVLTGSAEGGFLTPTIKPKLTRAALEDFFAVPEEEIERLKRSTAYKALEETAQTLRESGAHVVRIPNLRARYWDRNDKDREVLRFPLALPYVNIVQDAKKAGRTAFVPRFGIQPLDEYVLQAFRSLGVFDAVRQIWSLDEAVDHGGMRCRIQIIGEPAAR